MPKVRLIDCIKLGFGFFIGYEVAKNLNEIAGEVYKVAKERDIKNIGKQLKEIYEKVLNEETIKN